MSYIDDDLVEDFLKMKSKREVNALPILKSRAVWKWGAVAAVFCLVVATSFVMLLHFPDQHTTPTVPVTSSNTAAPSDTVTPESTTKPTGTVTPESADDPDFTLPVPIDEIIWYVDKGGPVGSDAGGIWNGMELSGELIEAIYQIEHGYESKEYLAIEVRCTDGELLDRYVYEGKSYAEHQEELESLRQLTYKYHALAREADMLKYGELLYTEGLPDGTKWTKEQYDERVAYYGEELLSKVIVNGAYRAQELEIAYRDNEKKFEEKEKMLRDLTPSFHKDSASAVAEAFEQYTVTVKNDIVFLFIKLSDFETINLENKEDYRFDLASRVSYDGYVEEPDVPVFDDSVSGFDYEKMVFDSIDMFGVSSFQPLSDEGVIDMINETIDKWKYTSDYLEFTFVYEGELTEEDFNDMQYFDIYQSDYMGNFPRMIVRVKYKDINLEAFKELSNRTEIKQIRISAPLTPVPA